MSLLSRLFRKGKRKVKDDNNVKTFEGGLSKQELVKLENELTELDLENELEKLENEENDRLYAQACLPVWKRKGQVPVGYVTQAERDKNLEELGKAAIRKDVKITKEEKLDDGIYYEFGNGSKAFADSMGRLSLEPSMTADKALIRRVDRNGKDLPNAFDLLVFKEGKLVDVVGHSEGFSAVKDYVRGELGDLKARSVGTGIGEQASRDKKIETKAEITQKTTDLRSITIVKNADGSFEHVFPDSTKAFTDSKGRIAIEPSKTLKELFIHRNDKDGKPIPNAFDLLVFKNGKLQAVAGHSEGFSAVKDYAVKELGIAQVKTLGPGIGEDLNRFPTHVQRLEAQRSTANNLRSI